MNTDLLIEVIRAVEWASFEQGQGSGFMSSGGNGPMVRACPFCKGIDPTDRHAHHFSKGVHNHSKDCKLKLALDLLGSGG